MSSIDKNLLWTTAEIFHRCLLARFLSLCCSIKGNISQPNRSNREVTRTPEMTVLSTPSRISRMRMDSELKVLICPRWVFFCVCHKRFLTFKSFSSSASSHPYRDSASFGIFSFATAINWKSWQKSTVDCSMPLCKFILFSIAPKCQRTNKNLFVRRKTRLTFKKLF